MSGFETAKTLFTSLLADPYYREVAYNATRDFANATYHDPHFQSLDKEALLGGNHYHSSVRNTARNSSAINGTQTIMPRTSGSVRGRSNYTTVPGDGGFYTIDPTSMRKRRGKGKRRATTKRFKTRPSSKMTMYRTPQYTNRMPEHMTITIPVSYSVIAFGLGTGTPNSGAKWSVIVPCNVPNPSSYTHGHHLGVLGGGADLADSTIVSNFYGIATKYDNYQIKSAKLTVRATPLSFNSADKGYVNRASDAIIFTTLADNQFTYMDPSIAAAHPVPTATGSNQQPWLDAVPTPEKMITARMTNSKPTHIAHVGGSELRMAMLSGNFTPERIFSDTEKEPDHLVATCPTSVGGIIGTPVSLAYWTITGMARGPVPTAPSFSQPELSAFADGNVHPHRLDITVLQTIRFSGFNSTGLANVVPS